MTVKRWEQILALEEEGLAGRISHHIRPAAAPTSSNSSQREVGRGQAGPSLCHYPSITCRPLSADNRTFSSLLSPFTPSTSFSSLWSLTPLLFLPAWLCFYDIHIFLLSICSPALAPFSAFYLSLFALLIARPTPSISLCHFPLSDSENSGVPLSETFLLSLQLISRLQQRYHTPTAAFRDRLQIEPNSFRGGALVSL